MDLFDIEIPVWKQTVLSGETAVVTGGTSGIGYSIADTFLHAGCGSIIITSRSRDRLDDSIKRLREGHPESADGIHGVLLDLEKTDSFCDFFQAVLDCLRGSSIDIWVNNAGIYRGTKFGSVSDDDWNALMDTNLKAQFFISQLVANHMVEKQTPGNILNICSSSSFRPSVDPYMLSKLGMSGLTLGMAKKLITYGIVVNGIAPGPTFTPMLHKEEGDSIQHGGVPAGRYVLPQEVANLAVFLTSPMGRMIVGDVVKMTGGSAVTTFDDVRY